MSVYTSLMQSKLLVIKPLNTKVLFIFLVFFFFFLLHSHTRTLGILPHTLKFTGILQISLFFIFLNPLFFLTFSSQSFHTSLPQFMTICLENPNDIHIHVSLCKHMATASFTQWTSQQHSPFTLQWSFTTKSGKTTIKKSEKILNMPSDFSCRNNQDKKW